MKLTSSTSRSTKSKTPTKQQTYHHGDLRRALLEASLALIAEAGPHGFTLREAARRAGVSQAAPYRHFPDKAALLAAIAEDGFRKLTESMKREVARAGFPDEARLLPSGLGYVLFAVAHPSHFRVMFGPPLSPGGPPPAQCEAGAESYQMLLDAIAAAQRAGLVRGRDPEPVARFAWAVVHGLASLAIDGQLGPLDEQSLRRTASEVLELSFTGMGARALPR